jgi:hypothetical protein
MQTLKVQLSLPGKCSSKEKYGAFPLIMLPSTVAVGVLVHKSLHISVILVGHIVLHKLHLLPEQHNFQLNPLASIS